MAKDDVLDGSIESLAVAAWLKGELQRLRARMPLKSRSTRFKAQSARN